MKKNNKIVLKGGYVSVPTMSPSEFGEHVKKLSAMSGTHKNKKREDKNKHSLKEMKKYI